MVKRLPAEWEPQSGVMLSWPHIDTDWAIYLDKVDIVFTEIAVWISLYELLIIVAPETKEIKMKLKKSGANLKNIRFYNIDTDDTWSRDFGPITIEADGKPKLLDFVFNGWGLKFSSSLDNQITRKLYQMNAFNKIFLKTKGFVLEGGSIDSDGKGTLLTTSRCLLSPNRNPHLSKDQIEKKLKKYFGLKKVLWLDHGYLAGDDTDSHIDTLARFCPEDTIVYMKCRDKKDEHCQDLAAMEKELKKLKTLSGKPYRLLPLPFPKPHFNEDGKRLPATYANFLAINNAVLMPTYEDEENDAEAKKVLKLAFPGREIIGINCLPLIYQYGSLHCVTMQLPEGVIR